MEVKDTEKLDYSSKFTGVYKVGDKYRGYLKDKWRRNTLRCV